MNNSFSLLNQLISSLKNNNVQLALKILDQGGYMPGLMWRVIHKHKQQNVDFLKKAIKKIEEANTNGNDSIYRKTIADNLSSNVGILKWWGNTFGKYFSPRTKENILLSIVNNNTNPSLPEKMLRDMDVNKNSPRRFLKKIAQYFRNKKKERAAQSLKNSNWLIKGYHKKTLLCNVFDKNTDRYKKNGFEIRNKDKISPVIARSVLTIANNPAVQYVKFACYEFDYTATQTVGCRL